MCGQLSGYILVEKNGQGRDWGDLICEIEVYSKGRLIPTAFETVNLATLMARNGIKPQHRPFSKKATVKVPLREVYHKELFWKMKYNLTVTYVLETTKMVESRLFVVNSK